MGLDVATFIVDIGILFLIATWMVIDIFDLRPKKDKGEYDEQMDDAANF